jgi:anti-sigma regulatory factor (Ser/Thr protein kinase)
MEIGALPSVLALEVRDASHVGEARRRAMALARSRGLSDITCGNVGIIATELTNNLVRHATEGLLLTQWIATPLGQAIEMLAVDRGAGMIDVGRCLQDGFTTAGTPGTGLGAIRRLSGEFDIYSLPGRGTVIVSRVFAQSGTRNAEAQALRWSAISRAAPGEEVCGDIWRVACRAAEASFMVADGLGHGPSAAFAAQAVADNFDRNPFETPARFLENAHREVSGTRGAAVAMAKVHLANGRLEFAGIGNIVATIVQPGAAKGLFSHNGTIGVQVRKIQSFEYTLPSSGVLIMHSDGIQSRWSLDDYPGAASLHPAIVVGLLVRDFKRGRDDLTVLAAKLGA